ncbi:unnamed protein product [Cuscuta epithymum]|uniref:Uncharacterized protein n=1 Tax=Cuscuta epithymum TaxID=186058 RepID=A0AAV0FK47_9ASTE|nr:unnamed protein product [Cuscuta epithymum]
MNHYMRDWVRIARWHTLLLCILRTSYWYYTFFFFFFFYKKIHTSKLIPTKKKHSGKQNRRKKILGTRKNSRGTILGSQVWIFPDLGLGSPEPEPLSPSRRGGPPVKSAASGEARCSIPEISGGHRLSRTPPPVNSGLKRYSR